MGPLPHRELPGRSGLLLARAEQGLVRWSKEVPECGELQQHHAARPDPDQEAAERQCSTLVDNVLSRYACKQCCDVQHVGLGHVGSPSWLATSVSLCLPSLCSGRVPEVRVLTVHVFRKGSRWLGFPNNMLTCLSNPEL